MRGYRIRPKPKKTKKNMVEGGHKELIIKLSVPFFVERLTDTKRKINDDFDPRIQAGLTFMALSQF